MAPNHSHKKVTSLAAGRLRQLVLVQLPIECALADPEEAWRVLMAPDPLALYAPFLPARAADVRESSSRRSPESKKCLPELFSGSHTG